MIYEISHYGKHVYTALSREDADNYIEAQGYIIFTEVERDDDFSEINCI